MIAREGYLIIVISIVLALVLLFVTRWVPDVVRPVLYVLAAFSVGFTLFFFRDPKRTPPPESSDDRIVLSPADGKVVAVAHEHEPHYIHADVIRVSIFLSPLDVHVNRIPAYGIVEHVDYVPGEYLVAWHPKASEKNERSVIGMRHPEGWRIVFKQIAGAVARRVVYHIAEGDTVEPGDRFGIVKFGSRMDVLVPEGSAISVVNGDRVRGGTSILGYLPPGNPSSGHDGN